MSQAQIDRIVAALRARTTPPSDLTERRQGFEQFAARLSVPPDPLPPQCALAPGLAGRWFGSAQTSTVVLYFHGGAFVVGSSASHAALTQALAEQSGIGLFSLDYPLAPEQPFPAAFDAGLAACIALEGEGRRVVLAGDSAGANIALAVAQARIAAGSAALAGVVCLSGYLDLTNTAATIASHGARDAFVAPPGMPMTARGYAGAADPADPRVSPLWGPFAGLPPLLLMVGTEEVLLDDTLRAMALAAMAGVAVTCEVWAGMIHAWPFFHGVLDEAHSGAARIAGFIRACADAGR